MRSETIDSKRNIDTKEKRGTNTELHFTFVRHSQKSSGNVFSSGTEGYSMSGISEAGMKRAEKYGEEELSGRNLNKAYATEIDRTRETLEKAIEGGNIETTLLQKSPETTAMLSMPPMEASAEFMKKYNGIMMPRRDQYVAEHFDGKEFDSLTPDEQEAAAEYAEEEALQWYLDFDAKRPDEGTPSPREQAASVAFKINRLVNLPNYMPAGKSVDLVSAGHKTSTEAFLKYVIEQEHDGKITVGFENLEEIGGSLKILDSWDLDVKNDEGGNKKCAIAIRREDGESKSYTLNLEAVKQLAKEFISANEIRAKKIDNVT